MHKTTIFQKEKISDKVHITLFLIDRFTMLPLSCIIEPLRLVNSELGYEAYSWTLVSRDGYAVQASNGIELSVNQAIHELHNPRNIIVCSGLDAHHYRDHRAFSWLRKWSSEGSHIGSVCTGAYILARIGLLNGYRCTVHWSSIDSLTEEFPQLEIAAELYEIDRKRFTCAGGTSALDMMLHDIEMRYGHTLSASVAEQFL